MYCLLLQNLYVDLVQTFIHSLSRPLVDLWYRFFFLCVQAQNIWNWGFTGSFPPQSSKIWWVLRDFVSAFIPSLMLFFLLLCVQCAIVALDAFSHVLPFQYYNLNVYNFHSLSQLLSCFVLTQDAPSLVLPTAFLSFRFISCQFLPTHTSSQIINSTYHWRRAQYFYALQMLLWRTQYWPPKYFFSQIPH